MVLGLGLDLVEIGRIERACEKPHFRARMGAAAPLLNLLFQRSAGRTGMFFDCRNSFACGTV